MVDYARAIRKNWLLEDDYIDMVTTTLMYAMHKRELMGKLKKLRSPWKQWYDHELLFTSWLPVDFMYPYGLSIDEQYDPSTNWNARLEDEHQLVTAISSCIMKPPTTPNLLWPCIPVWIIGFCSYMVHPNCLLAHMMQIHCCLSCKAPLHCRLYKEFGVQWGMPPNYEYNIAHSEPPTKYGNPLASNWHTQ